MYLILAAVTALLIYDAHTSFRFDYHIDVSPIISFDMPHWIRLDWHVNGIVAATCFGYLAWFRFNWPGFWHVPLNLVPGYLLDLIVQLLGMVLVL